VLKTKGDLIVEYVVSDSFLTLADVAARATSYKWVSAKGYDLAKEPEMQDLAAGTFDIITAFNALHVTNISSTLFSFNVSLFLEDRLSWQRLMDMLARTDNLGAFGSTLCLEQFRVVRFSANSRSMEVIPV